MENNSFLLRLKNSFYQSSSREKNSVSCKLEGCSKKKYTCHLKFMKRQNIKIVGIVNISHFIVLIHAILNNFNYVNFDLNVQFT